MEPGGAGAEAADQVVGERARVNQSGVGGELWTVWNSHLPYLPMLRARVGSTSVVTQNPRFTVTRSRRPG